MKPAHDPILFNEDLAPVRHPNLDRRASHALHGQNSLPSLISFRTGGIVTGVIGVLMMPGKLLSDYGSCIFGWLVDYSGLLGPIAGIMIPGYFIIRGREMNLDDLYRRDGRYEYGNGVNPRALAGAALGVVIALLGPAVPGLPWLY